MLNRVSYDRISTKRLHKKGNKVLLILESEELTTTVLFDHKGEVCATDEYETKTFFSKFKNSESKKTNDQVYADDDGIVWRIFNMSQNGDIDENEPP